MKRIKCPKCGKEVGKLVLSEVGKAGGKKSRRVITAEQQRKMQEGRGKK